MTLVLLCYVDESNHGDFHGFAALLADEHATKALTDDLNRIMSQASVDFGIPRTTEFHAHPMFHGKDEWSNVGARARVGLFFKVVNAITSADVTMILRSVDNRLLKARQARENYRVHFPAEQVCFQHILQRANRVAKRQDTYALMIADNRSDRERHRERFATYQTSGTPGVYMHTTLERLLDTVHFAPSHQSRMLQAADMLAFIYRRRMTVFEQDIRSEQAMAKLWGRIIDCGKLCDVGSWP
ncbi:DUF3800 domain-containing protein [Nocardioides mesophilus]|uniref:DUF3800 domain-containing protein n=1 Tax=Nocardioides mesophilus TaxID=433659 RepID=A0A7G9RG76_9ACTN|nr:DUF3800 domain-containing protein [Nocardioides mesophilus]QNN54601.1 DUF3800 domain-containing protein [Nocardioides mesophilus]